MFRSTLYCSTCGDERAFEQPPCIDGHGADCPELACTGCGMAIVVGDFPPTGVDAARPQPVPARYRAA